ncbi:MAG: hypothetical protein QM536_00270 [Chitinophagaceae bacterium]|nr:hypothetical protein [Chitinophagaceae bacterium]
MYIIKTKGTHKIPDCVQIRNDDMSILVYFRADRIIDNLGKYGFSGKEKQLKEIIDTMPFGKLQKLTI